MSNMKLSIVIPFYNEVKRVRKTFARIDRFFRERDHKMEYVFVEDGSRDGTLKVLEDLKKDRDDVKVLVNKKNMGKGYSIRRGVLTAEGDYILFMDADMSTSLKAFSHFEKYLGDCDIVIGTRWCAEADIKIRQPWHRRFMGVVFYKIINSLYLTGITDVNCGFKCYKKNVAKDIFSKQLLRGWGSDVEILYIAEKWQYRIKEVPVVWAHGLDSKVNLFVAPISTLVELIRIKINDWKRRYEK